MGKSNNKRTPIPSRRVFQLSLRKTKTQNSHVLYCYQLGRSAWPSNFLCFGVFLPFRVSLLQTLGKVSFRFFLYKQAGLICLSVGKKVKRKGSGVLKASSLLPLVEAWVPRCSRNNLLSVQEGLSQNGRESLEIPVHMS